MILPHSRDVTLYNQDWNTLRGKTQRVNLRFRKETVQDCNSRMVLLSRPWIHLMYRAGTSISGKTQYSYNIDFPSAELKPVQQDHMAKAFQAFKVIDYIHR